jgi:dynein light intermediate chain 1
MSLTETKPLYPRIGIPGLDAEGVSSGWMLDLEAPSAEEQAQQANDPFAESGTLSEPNGAIAIYRQEIKNPHQDRLSALASSKSQHGLEVEITDSQKFLSQQFDILSKLKVQDQEEKKSQPGGRDRSLPHRLQSGTRSPEKLDSGRVTEHIGPVQFNMGGIQVDADDMLSKLKVRNSHLAITVAAAANMV